MLNILLSTGAIAGIAAGGAVALIAICLLLYFLVFKHFRYKKQVDELERKFEYLHGLLTGQDARWMRQIEQIASSNLLFVSRHQTFEKRFKDLRDKGDASAQKAINDLLSMLSDHDYKALKEALPVARRTIAEFDDAANSLHNDLNALIKPEEDCRAAAYAVKEKFRAIKQDYNVKSSELSLCSASFEAVFAKLEDMFTKFEKLVSCAQYEDANAIIPEVDRVLDELSKAIAELPNICVSIQTVIPDKLLSLENRYEEMARLVGVSWRQNQALDSGTNPPAVQAIIDRIADLCYGYKLPGAGGGGYLYMAAKDEEAAARIRRILNENRPNEKARFVEMALSDKGLEVSRR